MFSPDKPVQSLTALTPRESNDRQRELLREQGRMAERELAAVQVASLDELTLLPNRHGFEITARYALQACERLGLPATLLFFELDGLSQINRLYGQDEGDAALKTFADALRIAFRESDVVGRLDGVRFAVLLTGAGHVETPAIMARLEEILDERNATLRRGYAIGLRIGQAEYDAERHASIDVLLREADKAKSAHAPALKKS